jgi:ketosteroid isomerase-like protein
MKRLVFCLLLLVSIGTIGARAQSAGDPDLLKTRELVWRAWFADDISALNRLLPPDMTVISAGEEQWKKRDAVLQEAHDFHEAGGKLLRLEFPRTEVQRFGNVAIIYSEYSLELEVGGKTSIEGGRVTETFVKRKGHWVNPGWHTDHEK